MMAYFNLNKISINILLFLKLENIHALNCKNKQIASTATKIFSFFHAQLLNMKVSCVSDRFLLNI